MTPERRSTTRWGIGDGRPRRELVTPRAARWLRRGAATLGLLGAVLAVAVPLLPVVQHTAVITWGFDGDTTALNAPLVAYSPQKLTATIPCAAAVSLDSRTTGSGTLLATTPPGTAENARGMLLQVGGGTLTVVSRGRVLGAVALPDPAATPQRECTIVVTSTSERTTVTADGFAFVHVTADVRPQVTGVYTDLTSEQDPVDGLGVRIRPDTRFVSVPTTVKLVAMIVAGVAVAASLAATHVLDARVGRRAPRLGPRGWWRPTKLDLLVVAILLIWLVIGTMTSDDGYILTMIRTADEMGYIGNYYRWFNVPEAPFGWPYEFYAQWAQISTAPPWLRIPALVMGVLSWLLISRQLVPRLGPRVRRSGAAAWAAAALFLAFWLPYNNGLRLEPVVTLGALLTWIAVERGVALRRIGPLLVGLLVAAFTLAASPTGIIALAPFLVSLRPITRIVRSYIAASGWPAVLGPSLGAGLVVLVAAFRDQTLASVITASRVRIAIGPSMSWFEEFYRYKTLFSPTPDGALTRRFPVLVLLLCLGTCLVILLRRGGIPGAAQGPSRRMIGIAAVSLALLTLTPTKWTHHFGAFAAIGGCMAALTALATSAVVLRSNRNRWWFVAALFAITALAFRGPNAPWYVSQFGVPWHNRSPTIGSVPVSTVLIALAGVAALIAVVETLRHEPGGPPPRLDTPAKRRRALLLGSTPLVVFCGLMVLFQVAVMGWAMYVQRGSYSLGAANLEHIFGGGCNLSDEVMVERNRSAGALPVLPMDDFGPDDLPGFVGFARGKLPPPQPDPGEEPVSEAPDGSRLATGVAENNPTLNPVGPPPPGIGPGTELRFWSSYSSDGPGTGEARTPWFGLPERAAQGEAPVVVAVAGQLGPATPIVAQFGVATPDGIDVVARVPVAGVPTDQPPGWRDYRLTVPNPPGAGTVDAVRLKAADKDVTPAGWVAFSAPRVPVVAPMTQVVGRDTPVLLDWPVGLVHPCLQPVTIHNGIVAMPEYRVMPDDRLARLSAGWSSAEGGGPLGWLNVVATQRELPTYLDGEPNTDWGQLKVVEPVVPGDDTPTVHTGTEVRSGWWSPGPLRPLGRPSSPLDTGL